MSLFAGRSISMCGRLLLLAAVAPLGAASAPAYGEAPGEARVAVVDLSALILQNRRFRAALDDLEAEGRRLEGELKAQRGQLAAQAAQRRPRPQGNSALSRAEAALAERRAMWQAETEAERQALLAQEDALYTQAYREAQRAVAAYCRRHRITLALQRSQSELTAEDPVALMQGIHRTVVYQERVNITPAVLERINAARGPRYGPPRFALDQLPGPAKFLVTLPALAVKRVAEVRASAALDRLVFPPAS